MNQADTTPIAGRNPVREALEREPGRIEKVMLRQNVSGEAIRAIRSAATDAGVALQYVPNNRLDHEAEGLNHQGVVAIAAPVEYERVNDLLASIAPDWDTVRETKPMLLIIDRVTDTRNFGAILRSAVAGGIDGVVVPNRHMAPLNAAAIRASAGTATRVPIARTNDLARFLVELKERGYWVVGADGSADTPYWEEDWDRPIALVVGSEDQGLRPDVAEACDRLVSIPMQGPAESLNVSVAAGILVFAAAQPRASASARP